MSVSIQSLTKQYGSQKAIDNISFDVAEGEIIGLLGPNGAGKTTTMKILSGYIPANEGTATVYGYDVAEEAIKVKQLIGYLPEHNPLYLDMYVREYLGMVAKIHQLPNRKDRVQEVISLTGLTLEAHKKIKMLSKGYRQRVGLAQAIIHNPKVLILDEPTSGLDPNQLVEIRQLIKSIGKDKIVIFSSHIMQEVEAICDRVIILNRGNLVADSPIRDLVSEIKGGQVITAEFEKAMDEQVLKNIDTVTNVNALSDRKVKIYAEGSTDIRPFIFDLAVSHSNRLLSMVEEQQDMEEVFQSLTANQVKNA